MTLVSPSQWRSPALGTLVAFAALLGAFGLAWQAMQAPISTAPIKRQSVNVDAGGDTKGARQSPLTTNDSVQTYTETMRRPLFFASRRMPTAEPVAPSLRKADAKPKTERQAALPSGIRLVGIAGGSNQGRRALIRFASLSNGKWFQTGADLAGWRIVAIESGSVTIESGDQQHVLRLFAEQGG